MKFSSIIIFLLLCLDIFVYGMENNQHREQKASHVRIVVANTIRSKEPKQDFDALFNGEPCIDFDSSKAGIELPLWKSQSGANKSHSQDVTIDDVEILDFVSELREYATKEQVDRDIIDLLSQKMSILNNERGRKQCNTLKLDFDKDIHVPFLKINSSAIEKK